MNEQAPATTPTRTQCSRCGEEFACGARMASCWCQQLPPLDLSRVEASAGCYCPDCLAALVVAQASAH